MKLFGEIIMGGRLLALLANIGLGLKSSMPCCINYHNEMFYSTCPRRCKVLAFSRHLVEHHFTERHFGRQRTCQLERRTRVIKLFTDVIYKCS